MICHGPNAVSCKRIKEFWEERILALTRQHLNKHGWFWWIIFPNICVSLKNFLFQVNYMYILEKKYFILDWSFFYYYSKDFSLINGFGNYLALNKWQVMTYTSDDEEHYIILLTPQRENCLSFWQNFVHCLHWKLSFWQLPVQPVTKILSTCNISFSVIFCAERVEISYLFPDQEWAMIIFMI